MGGKKLMGFAVILLGIALIVLAVGVMYRDMNAGTTNETSNPQPYSQTETVK